MKLRNILLAIGALYFLTRKKEKNFFDPKKDSVNIEEKDSLELEEKDRKPEVFDIEKREVKTVSE